MTRKPLNAIGTLAEVNVTSMLHTIRVALEEMEALAPAELAWLRDELTRVAEKIADVAQDAVNTALERERQGKTRWTPTTHRPEGGNA